MYTSFITVVEFMGPGFRAYGVILHNICFALGFMTLPGVAYVFRDFTHMQIVLACPVLLCFAYIW